MTAKGVSVPQKGLISKITKSPSQTAFSPVPISYAAVFWFVLWFVVVALVVGLYKLFIAFRKWVKSGKPAVIADKIGGKTSAALGLTNPFIRTPVVWACRIIGPIACLGGIAFAIDAINGETAKPDDPGLGGGIATFLLSCVMTAYGYWPRKKQPS